MPNWCENTLTVFGAEKDLKKFVEEAKSDEEPLSFAKTAPEPDYSQVKVKSTYPSITKKEFVDTEEAWWDWRIQNWGTKWDLSEVQFEDYGDFVEYSFMSAWSPPVEWLKIVSERYPKLEFKLKYDEPGMAFMGAARAEDGVVDDKSVEY